MPYLFSPKFPPPQLALRQTYDGIPVVPSDTVDLPVVSVNPCVGLYITGAGTIACQLRSGVTATITAPAGVYIDAAITRVLATGTTATGIFQLADPQG